MTDAPEGAAGPEFPGLPWPLVGNTDLRDRLVAAYSSGRGYHDVQHLGEVLARVAELGEGGNTEVVLAAWFHDAVYDGAADDEERSARMAEEDLAGVPEVDAVEVARLVRITADHDPAPGDHAAEVLCDADLAILAADPERYAEYADGVRRDYAHVPDTDFRAGRTAILEDLLAREELFRTAYAREHWDLRARENLAAEIAALRSPE